MKKCLLSLLLALLLCGCTHPAEPAADTLPAAAQPQITEPNGFYDPGSPLEAKTGGAVRCYPLGSTGETSLLSLGDDLLLISCSETETTLTVLTGETLRPTARLGLSFPLTVDDPCLRRWDGGISFFDPQAREIVVLDGALREVARIPAPKELQGTPLLCADRSTLYYCTSDAVRALDLESGISRCLKEIAYPAQEITGAWMEDTVVECTISDADGTQQTLFLSAENGQILGTAPKGLTLSTSGSRYYAAFPNGSVNSLVFGTGEEPASALTPMDPGTGFHFLPEDHAALVVRQQEQATVTLDYYDLDTGIRTSVLTLEFSQQPWGFETAAEGKVFFLNYDEGYGCNTLYLWDTTGLPSRDDTICTGPHYTLSSPDYDGLAACSLYAQEISQRYGIRVLVYKDAVDIQPWDYDLEVEHLAPVIREELEQLDARLGNYPEGFLQTLSQRFDGLTLCIVRSISGTAESGSLDAAKGVQFWEGHHAYIALAAGAETEYTLYHELCHLIDTVVLSESSAYDRWDELNPSGFEYDYDYIANQSRNSSEYLREGSRYFIDMYSMSFPKEDRARIMEHAMTEGNAACFQSKAMQAKLKLLCQGIREAFGLRKSPETFLWEQYLNESLAYTK